MPKKNLYFYITIICFVSISNCLVAADLPYKEGELLVRFAPRANGSQKTTDERNQILSSLNAGKVKHSYKRVSGLTLAKLPEGVTVENAIPRLKQHGDILYAEPNYKIKLASTTPNDQYFGYQWGLTQISAPAAWDIRTDSDVIVAVIDTGVDYHHPDLAANMWADANGSHGYDFHNDDNDPMDDDGHGTHVAGIIGAVGNNEKGIAGVCWNVKLMSLKVFPNTDEEKFIADEVNAIDYAVDKGAKIINASYGGPNYSTAERDMIAEAGAAGVLVVACAQNYGQNIDVYHIYPACYNLGNIVSVMATDSFDERGEWGDGYKSNYGPNSVDLGAPGVDIFSCIRNGNYGSMSGTSMATPFVAGTAALLRSICPGLTPAQVRHEILDSVDVVSGLSGKCFTGGRLNLYKALTYTDLTLTNVDNITGTILPGQTITYTISYRNTGIMPVDNVTIVDYLTEDVSYIEASEPNVVYNAFDKTVTWDIGTLSRGESGSVTLIVQVKYLAEPLGTITNRCEMTSPTTYDTATETTNVGQWSPMVIYVDVNAPGSKTGMSWHNAYKDLQYALGKVRQGCGFNIWVAKGRYKPTTDPCDCEAAFQLVSGKALYGGFAGGETSLNQRNWLANETILDGDIDGNGAGNVNYVVTASECSSRTIIDGFTIRKSKNAAMLIIGSQDTPIVKSSPTVKRNKIVESDYGIQCIYHSEPNIVKCFIKDNSSGGIDCWGDSVLDVNNCVIRNNHWGIYYNGSSPSAINNSLICDNGTRFSSGYGMYINNPSALIRNNTVVNNKDYGITASTGTNIKNCILWGNNNWGSQLSGGTATYSCIQNVSTPNNNHNIPTNPNFIVNDPNYHIGPTSPCRDKGDGTYSNETDIDGEPRMIDGDGDDNHTVIVDMGTDEFYWSKADYNKDSVVNFLDYYTFANAWQTTNANVSLDSDTDVDYLDLRLFHTEWLWQPAWLRQTGQNWLMGEDDINDVNTIEQGESEMGGESMMAREQCEALVGSEQMQVEPPPVDIEAVAEMLDEIWASGDFNPIMTEQEYLEFRQTVLESLQQ